MAKSNKTDLYNEIEFCLKCALRGIDTVLDNQLDNINGKILGEIGDNVEVLMNKISLLRNYKPDEN